MSLSRALVEYRIVGVGAFFGGDAFLSIYWDLCLYSSFEELPLGVSLPGDSGFFCGEKCDWYWDDL
jgi:hypothetical protein